MSLGAFSPFARNHNTRTALSQEPYRVRRSLALLDRSPSLLTRG